MGLLGQRTVSQPFTPRGYQSLAIRYLMEHERCNLWADMGLGKTVSSLTMLDNLALWEDPFPALVLGPLRVARGVWTRETRKWAHLKGLKIAAAVGSVNDRRAALRSGADIITTNHENIPWMIDNCYNKGKAWPFRTVISDESTRLKGFRLRNGGQRAAKLGRVAFHPRMRRWVNLTGLAAPNGLLDLWGQQWFVDGGHRLGLNFTNFKERWFRPHPDGQSAWIPLPFAEPQIHAALADCTLAIRAADWFDIKDPIVETVYVDLPAKARRAYKEMQNKLFMELNGLEFEAFSSAAKSQKCLQLASGAVYLNNEDGPPMSNKPYSVAHDEKLDALQSIVEEAAGAPVLVAYHFKSDLERLLKRFKGARQLLSAKDEADWNAGKIPVLLAHPASAGHGLNLQHGGNRIVFFSHDWNLENYAQINERLGPVRQMQSGYNRPVYIYHIVARGTLDEVVIDRRISKRAVADCLRDAMLAA